MWSSEHFSPSADTVMARVRDQYGAGVSAAVEFRMEGVAAVVDETGIVTPVEPGFAKLIAVHAAIADTATVIVNTLPRRTSDSDRGEVEVDPGSSFTVDLTEHFTDPDGDSLSFAIHPAQPA